MPPVSDHDWTIHSLNIHGLFLERWVAAAIAKAKNWRVRSAGYPVKVPPDPKLIGYESAIDVVAEAAGAGRTRLTLAIECKKNNVDFVNWIFFQSRTPRRISAPLLTYGMYSEDELPGWHIGRRTLSEISLCIADEGRETRGNYSSRKNDQSKTKTSNAAISEASYQAAIGAQALAWEELSRAEAYDESERTSDVPIRGWGEQIFLPVIVTTARPVIASFNADDVSAATGEIAYGDVTLSEVPFLIYDYPLPRHLQAPAVRIEHMLDEEYIESWSRLHVAVVSSAHLGDFLSSPLVEHLLAERGLITA